MIGRTNTGGGGGGLSPNSAVIHVTAPVGSTISFSKGGVVAKVLGPEKSHVSADDTTLAEWYYAISSSNYGTWTVTATLETDTASDTVMISSNKQYDLALSYRTYIYRRGYINTALTGGLTNSGYTYSSNSAKVATYNSDNIYISQSYACAGTSQAIDLTDYSTIYFVVYPDNPSNPTHPWLGVALTKNLSNSVVKLIPNSYAELTLSADISNLTGNYYIATMSSSSNGYGYVYEIYLV